MKLYITLASNKILHLLYIFCFRFDVRKILLKYKVKFPDDINHLLDDMILELCCPECIDSTFRPGLKEENMCLKLPDLTLCQLLKFYTELESFFKPIKQNTALWLLTRQYHLLDIYVEAFLEADKCKSATPIETLSAALEKTKTLLSRVVKGEDLTYGDYTVCEILQPSVLSGNVFQELMQINKLIDLYQQGDGVEIHANISKVTNMLTLFLFKAYGHISTVIEVCELYEMQGCLSDVMTKELKEILNMCLHSDRRRQISPEMAGTYLKLIQEAFLLDDLSPHMKLFDEVKHCKIFYKFIVDLFFSNDQDMKKGQLHSFNQWHAIISNQLQNVEFEEQILHHLKKAFDYILPFVNKKQTLRELMYSIKELDTTTEFEELKTVNSNMHLIERWSSLAEVHNIYSLKYLLKCSKTNEAYIL